MPDEEFKDTLENMISDFRKDTNKQMNQFRAGRRRSAMQSENQQTARKVTTNEKQSATQKEDSARS